MHEISIVANVIEIVVAEAAFRDVKHVRRINLKIGKLQAVAPEALQFCFGLCAAGTAVEGAELAIECVPIRGLCEECASEFEIPGFRMRCPKCGGGRVTVTSGKELDVESFET